VNGRRQVDRRVLLGVGRPDQRPDLLWLEYLDVARARHPVALDLRDRIQRQVVDRDGPPEHPVQEHDDVVLRLVRQRLPARPDQRRPPPLDVLRRDVLQPPRPERRQQGALIPER
jgi:hypothetical protein